VSYRTDRNNNPTAFTTAIALEAGLAPGIDYVIGDPFPAPSKLFTAKLLGNPVALTIDVIDRVGFYTDDADLLRWAYIAIPVFVWKELTVDQQRDVIGFMYSREGGVTMRPLFPNFPAGTQPSGPPLLSPG